MSEPWVWWVGLGLLLLAAEAVLPGVFLVWIGLAAIGAGLGVLAFGFGLAASCAVFVTCLAAGVAASLRRRRPAPVVNDRGAGLIGRSATLITADAGGARVRLGDSIWPARLLRPAPPGAMLDVVAVENTTLVVRPLDDAPLERE